MKLNNIKRGLFGSKRFEKQINKINQELYDKNKLIEKLTKENEICNKTIEALEEKIKNKDMLIETANISLDEKIGVIKTLKDEIRKLNGSKGGYTAKINDLEKELEITKHKLEESMTDKYLIRKLRTPKTPTQKIKASCGRLSNQTKRVQKEKAELRGE